MQATRMQGIKPANVHAFVEYGGLLAVPSDVIVLHLRKFALFEQSRKTLPVHRERRDISF